MASPDSRAREGGTPSRLAFLGLGTMGRPMAANLVRAGFEVVAWNRTAARAEELAAEHGARAAATPAEAARGAQAVVTMVVDTPQVEAVLLGPDGALEGLPQGGLCIDMSTIAPSAARDLAGRIAERGAEPLDAPVTGSRPKAQDGTLTIMVGGGEPAFARARPLFEAMGQVVVHVGPSGHGQMAKVINNTVAAINAAAVAEALTVARAAGLDMAAFLEVARAGSGSSAMLELKSRPMLERDFEPLFKLEHMLKDVRHCLAEAGALGLDLPVGALAERLYAAGAEAGHGGEDFAAVVTAVEEAARRAEPVED